MSDIRRQWLETALKYKLNPLEAGTASVWSPDLEQIPRQRLMEIQSEKLVVAFRYLYEESPYYNDKFRNAGLKPGDVTSVKDLTRIPITTKHEWLKNQADHPPWGTFSPLTQERWTTHG